MHANIPRRLALPRILAAVTIGGATLAPLGAESAPPGALHRAILQGNPAAWRELLAETQEVNQRNDAGDTPLHLAAWRGDAAAVDALLARGADATLTNEAGATPLHYGTAREDIVAALLAHGAPADAVSKLGATPLLAAVAHPDSFAVVRRLVDAGADVNRHRATLRGPQARVNALAVAVEAGDRRTIRLLLDHGAEVNPAAGSPPLASAAFAGDLDTIRLLLDRGADINLAPEFAGTALNFAFVSNHLDAARVLIERGADLNRASPRGHATPPMVFSAYNDQCDPTMAELLVKRGVDINVANEYGETALSYALKRGADTPVVRYLRSAGARSPTLIRADRTKSIPMREVPADAAARTAMVRDAAQRAVELLQRNSTTFLTNGFVQQVRCVSCHQQALPAVAFGLARERGLRIDNKQLGRQLQATLEQRRPAAENARQMDEPTPNASVTLGYDLDGLHALGYAPDDMTDGLTQYLIEIQRADGSWGAFVQRPPIEDGPMVGAAWAIRALQLYPPAGGGERARRAVERARDWLAAQSPRYPNERIFQLLGLAWAGDRPERLKRFMAAVIKAQQPDGGWAQLPSLPSDAWATGSALVALHKAGMAPGDRVYQRGVDFLLRTQFVDGSWWVRSRSWPFQPHFDGQFPHGKDQWISAGGTAFATIALLATIPPTVDAATLPRPQELIAEFTREAAPAASLAVAPSRGAASHPPARTAVSFTRDIQPVIERSCGSCHIGEKVRGQFSLASREALLKGGQSGDPAVVPGRSRESQLLRYVADEIEDLEMPPLSKREKYPALTAAEIALLRDWIDAGAEWDKSQ